MSRANVEAAPGPLIMDTTLRDGSYALNFRFTAGDTALIAAELERAGLRLIEIGHGVGLGARQAGKGEACETDAGYLEAAASALSKAQFGMFCIPGIARLEHLDLAADHGMGFIRIGTNVTETSAAGPFIAKAKKLGMLVCSNLMKSYAMSPAELAQQTLVLQDFGADVVYVVDSAGGMMTSELEAYIQAIQKTCSLRLGFHGHNNLGLAVANSIRAAEMGVWIVDSSLQGLGRSAGNAPTEMLAAALLRKGLDPGVDLMALLDAGEKYIRPLMRRRGWSSLDVAAGLALFHTSYMGVIRKYSNRFQVDPRRLILKVCEQNMVEAPPELVERTARAMAHDSDEVYSAKFDLDAYVGDEQDQ